MTKSASTPGSSRERVKTSRNPSNMPQVTNAPTARKATSFTSDSKAIAATIPSCRSEASRWRVPNMMVKAARMSAAYSAVSPRNGPPWPAPTTATSCEWTIVKAVEIAFSWSEM
jgi:hypothetical protein